MKANWSKQKAVVFVKPKMIMQYMHGIIPWMFDSWADLVVHILVLKSSMAHLIFGQSYKRSMIVSYNPRVVQHFKVDFIASIVTLTSAVAEALRDDEGPTKKF